MNIKELAERLDVSPSTISRVLNDKPGISDTTRQRVLEEVKKTGFTLNQNARNLAKSDSGFIGIIGRKRGGQQDSLYFHHSMSQFEDCFEGTQYQCINLSVQGQDIEQSFSERPLKINDYAGFIIRGQSFPVKTIISLKHSGVPLVLLENRLQETPIDHIICEDRITPRKLTEHLIERGYKTIVHFTGPEGWFNNRERIEGYKEAVQKAGSEARIISLADTTVDTGAEAFDLMRKEIKPPFGAVMANDAMAIGFLDAARKAGFDVPAQVGITGFDDIPWAKLSYPPLTTAKVFIEEMSRLAASRLLELINNPDSHPISIQVPADVVIRETT